MRSSKMIARMNGLDIDIILFLLEDGIVMTGGTYTVGTVVLKDIDGNTLLSTVGPYLADANGEISIAGTLLSSPSRGTPLMLSFIADFNGVTPLKMVETFVYF